MRSSRLAASRSAMRQSASGRASSARASPTRSGAGSPVRATNGTSTNDQGGVVRGVVVQTRRDKQAAKRVLRKLLKRQTRVPRVMITDKLASYSAAKDE